MLNGIIVVSHSLEVLSLNGIKLIGNKVGQVHTTGSFVRSDIGISDGIGKSSNVFSVIDVMVVSKTVFVDVPDIKRFK